MNKINHRQAPQPTHTHNERKITRFLRLLMEEDFREHVSLTLITAALKHIQVLYYLFCKILKMSHYLHLTLRMLETTNTTEKIIHTTRSVRYSSEISLQSLSISRHSS
jgi:hypothetical protein